MPIRSIVIFFVKRPLSYLLSKIYFLKARKGAGMLANGTLGEQSNKVGTEAINEPC